jgi:hypothetical protein
MNTLILFIIVFQITITISEICPPDMRDASAYSIVVARGDVNFGGSDSLIKGGVSDAKGEIICKSPTCEIIGLVDSTNPASSNALNSAALAKIYLDSLECTNTFPNDVSDGSEFYIDLTLSAVFCPEKDGDVTINVNIVIGGTGSSDSVFVLKTSGMITFSDKINIILGDSINACNVFFSGNSITSGSRGSLSGNLFADGPITIGATTILTGNLYSIEDTVLVDGITINRCSSTTCRPNPICCLPKDGCSDISNEKCLRADGIPFNSNSKCNEFSCLAPIEPALCRGVSDGRTCSFTLSYSNNNAFDVDSSFTTSLFSEPSLNANIPRVYKQGVNDNVATFSVDCSIDFYITIIAGIHSSTATSRDSRECFPTGCCCYGPTQIAENLNSEQCASLGGVFNSGMSCSGYICQKAIFLSTYCFDNERRGIYCTTYFSYNSLNTIPITIASTLNNFVTCNSINLGNIGQPIIFNPGNNERIWAINSTFCQNCVWRLNTGASN